jgi:tRNA-(ms[2]io[6]A)-hydroxylase
VIGRDAAVKGIDAVLEFLPCRTPQQWVDEALGDLPTLLRDHAALELKAAQQAQRLIWKYGMRGDLRSSLADVDRDRLRSKLSRLAREELRHFEQVLELLNRRGIAFEPVSASRYAGALHREIADAEPQCFIDTLVVAAVIEARSCERFYSLLPSLESSEPELARFYESLLKSEARHFTDYLELARSAAAMPIEARVGELLELERRLISSADKEFRFHSGVGASMA